METFLSNLNQKGQGLDDVRFKKSEYGALEDLGSTLASKKKNHTGGSQPSSQTSWQSKPSKFKPSLASSSKSTKSVVQAKDYTKQPIPTSNKKKNIVLSSESEGDSDESDEMNIRPSSQAGDFDEPARSQKPVKVFNQIRTGTSEAIGGKKPSQAPKYYTDGAGKKHSIDPKYNNTSTALAGLKFKKKTDTAKVTSTASNENQFVPKPNLWSFTPSPVKEKDSKMSSTGSKTCEPSLPSPLGKKSSNSNRPRSPSPSRSRPQDVEPPRPRPKPRPKRAATESSQSNKPSETFVPSQSKLVSMIDKVASTSRQSRVRRSESVECSSPRKTRPDPFPMRSLTSSRPCRYSDSPPLRESSASPVSDATSRKIPGSRTPSGFPVALTPKKSKEKYHAVATVKPDKTRNKGKGKAKQESEDEDEYDSFLSDLGSNKAKKKKERNSKKTAVKARAFPMSTQMLASIASPSAPSSSNKSSSVGSPLSRKRYSDNGSADGRISKKSRQERDLLLESPTRLPWEEGFSINISANVDPKTLCPYCDMPLPSTPSPLLVRLLEATKKKSVCDPRPSNPLGLKAPLVTFITVCQRHRFESEILPEAEAKGWPKDIKWKEVSGRVLKMEKALQALIEDHGDAVSASEAEGDSWEVVYKKDMGNRNKKKGPKARCIFWTEFLHEVKLKGLRAVSGVRGQFENFEKTQPGYYGEIGSVIIHQTLYDMFPLADMDPVPISPLTPTEFVQRILVPEVALRLIMEDKGLSGDEGMAKALEILRDSSSYGVAMFPEDGGEWGGKKKKDEKMGAGDLIVMERARKRRKELEEEEREEREFAERSKKEKQDFVIFGNTSEANEPIARPRPKPRPRKRLPGSASVANDTLPSGSEMDLEHSSDVGKQTRSRSKSILSDRSNKNYNERFQPTPEEIRRSPSASESRTFGREDSKPRMTTRMASLSLDSDSDASRARRSRSRAASKRKGKDKAMPVDHEEHTQESDDDDQVVIINHKTPVARRQRTPEVVDEEQTPKAQPIHKEQSGGIADILRRRRNEENSKSHQVVSAPDSEKRKPTKPGLRREESFGWVLNSEE